MSTTEASTVTDTATKKFCVVCGKDSQTRCSQCQSSWYCGRNCQKKDWKQHKKTCFPPNSTCTRCQESTSSTSLCRVPHPEYLMKNMGSMYGGGEVKMDFSCSACRQQFTKSQKQGEDGFRFTPAHAEWCYQGPHTIKSVPSEDRRVVRKDVVTIQAEAGDTAADIEAQLQSMDASTVRILVVQPVRGVCGYAEDVQPTLDVSMPLLEEIQLLDVAFHKIVLNAEKTPRLQKIELQNIPDGCQIQVKCPSLLHFDCRYHHGDCQWVQEMLDTATKLQTFRSYKLGMGDISFAGNHLEEIHIHRSDCLETVSIWAPRLEYLRLQGCYSLEELKILNTHKTLSKQLPAGFSLSQFGVNTTNSCLSAQVVRTLKQCQRALWEGEEEDEYAGIGGTGMEAMFRRMHQGL